LNSREQNGKISIGRYKGTFEGYVVFLMLMN